MAVQDPRLAGYGVRQLTPEEVTTRDARQAAYQRDLAQRQAQQAQQFQQTQAAGLANQAGRAFVPEPAPAPVVSPQAMQRAETAMQDIAGRAVANALPPSPTLGLAGVTGVQAPAPTATQPATAAPATTLSPDILADANQRIAQAITQSAAPQTLMPAERGNYNMTNTDRAALAERAAPAAGLSGLGQFGGQSATEYLGTMRAQDQANVDRRVQAGEEARTNLERSALQRATTQGSTTDRAAARRALGAFETQQLQQTQEAGATTRAGMEVAGQLDQTRQQAASQAEQARIQGQFGLQEANLRGQFGLDQAQLTGEYGVQSAMERAAGAVQSAQAGVDPLKAQRAELLATRLRQLNAKIQAGTATDEDFLNYTSTAAAARDNTAQNPITGAPLSAAEIELEQRRNLERLQQTR